MSTEKNNYVGDYSGIVNWMLLYAALALALYVVGRFITMEVMKWLYAAYVPAAMIHFVLVLRRTSRIVS